MRGSIEWGSIEFLGSVYSDNQRLVFGAKRDQVDEAFFEGVEALGEKKRSLICCIAMAELESHQGDCCCTAHRYCFWSLGIPGRA